MTKENAVEILLSLSYSASSLPSSFCLAKVSHIINRVSRRSLRTLGEALNLDLSDFVTQLYSLILPLMLVPDIERSDAPSPSTADMLFQALNVVFRPKNAGNNAPPWRSAAFAKRLLTASLSWPAKTALRAIEFVGDLVAKEGKVGALLSTEDRTADGAYRSDVDDPQLANPFGSSFWELHILRQSHPSEDVRGAAAKLASFVRNG